MKRVAIYHDPFDISKNTTQYVDSVLDYLKSEFKEFPKHARIYHNAWHADNDITEKMQTNENYADSLDGMIIIVIYPSEPISAAIWALYALVAVSLAASLYMFLTMPKPPSGMNDGSSNNDLGNRQNKIRIGGRVPDIYGTLNSYPDLIAPAYRYYENNTEVEEILAVIGRGYYEVSAFKEGDTSIDQINGLSVSAYDPNTNITSASPMFRRGDLLTYAPLIASQSKSISGQTLLDPSYSKIISSAITFSFPNIINVATESFSAGETIVINGATFGINDESLSGTANLDFTNKVITVASTKNILNPENFKTIEVLAFGVVDTVNGSLNLAGRYKVLNVVKSGSYVYQVYLDTPETVNQNWFLLTEDNSSVLSADLTNNTSGIDLDGTYVITSNDGSKLTLSAPDSINPNWLKIGSSIGGQSVSLSGVQDNWLGWFESSTSAETGVFNFLAPQGLYYVGKKGWKERIYLWVEVEYQRIDVNGNPTDIIHKVTEPMQGDYTQLQNPIAKTVKIDFGFNDRIRYRVRRVIDYDPNNGNTNIDDVQARSVFLCTKLNKLIYDDVTIVRAKTINNETSSGIKERLLNCLVTRRLPLNGTGALTATNSGAQALINIALDQKNGRRTLSEIDIVQILAEEQAVINYFDNPKAAEFSYTFDDNNLSFEEMAGMVASTMFCEAYRYGSKLRLRFEKPQDNSVLLFNHTNKAPNSEKRTKSFGIENNYDGVEVEYTSPSDDTRITFVATDSSNPINTLKIKTSGIRSDEQAKTRAWREWNKLKYRNMSVEFEAWEESELLARMDRILVADNTLIETIDGEVEAVEGLKLYLSQPIPQAGNYNIYLQLPNATVDIVPCTYIDEYSVQLTRMPKVNLAIGRATYQLILSSSPAPKPFLMTELRPQSKMTNMLTCVNYDSRYYANDLEFF